MRRADLEGYRPRADPRVAVVDCDSGAVLMSPEGQIVELDAQARALWSLFDGQATLGELADDVVAVFEGADRGTVVADLSQLVTGLARSGLLHDGPGPLGADAVPPVDRLEAPASCCGNRLGDEDWRPTLACRVGGRLIGVRTQDDRLDRELRDLLGPTLVEAEDVPPNLSVVWRPADAVHDASRIEVHSQLRLMVASTSARQARRFLASELGALSDLEPDRLWIRGLVVGGDGGVVVLSRSYLSSLGFLAPMLGRRGLAIGPSRVAVDVATGEVVVVAPSPEADVAATVAFDDLAAGVPSWPEPLAPGRHRLRAIGTGAIDGSVDPGVGTTVAAHLRSLADWVCVDRAADFQATVDALLALQDLVDPAGPDPTDVAGWIDGRLA